MKTNSYRSVLFQNENLADIAEKVEKGIHLSFEDGVRLFESHDLLFIGRLAHRVRTRLHGKKAFYAVNLHLNYTNICSARCLFCAFSRRPGDRGAYALTVEQMEETIRGAAQTHRINEVHVVGGLNPDLNLDYYLSLLSAIRQAVPGAYLKAFTAVEIADLAERFEITRKELLILLKQAGLNGLPGGGAEIFREEMRKRICSHKVSSEGWLGVHRTAHKLNLPSNATMLYGHVESIEDRIDHLLRLRTLQDETHGFRAFVPLQFRPFRPFRPEQEEQEEQEGYPEHSRLKRIEPTDGYTDLKVLAISRLFLDNIPHIRFHWPAFDFRMLPIALHFGADDAGGTNVNEAIMREAGSKPSSACTEEKLRAVIKEAGFEPVCSDSSYSESNGKMRQRAKVRAEN